MSQCSWCSFRCWISVPPAPWTMHFGHAGGAGGIEDVERMVERQLLERRVRALVAARAIRSRRTCCAARRMVGSVSAYGTITACSTVGSCADDLASSRARSRALAAVEIAVGSDEDARLDLPEAIEHALHAEIRRARRPHRSHRGRAERRDDRFRQIRQVAGDPVARPHADLTKRRRKARHRDVQFSVADRPESSFAVEDQRRSVIAAAEHVRGEVEPCIREELRARHLVRIHCDTAAHLAANVRKRPQLAPEICRPCD